MDKDQIISADASGKSNSTLSTTNASLGRSFQWNVWKTIEYLEATTKKEKTLDHHSLIPQVITILQTWGNAWAGKGCWQSFLNKRSFQHEIEESMVAVHLLNEWRKKQTTTKCQSFIAVDVCAGKGVFSMLLQYMASFYWETDTYAKLDQIILLEKATCDEIDWRHLEAPPAMTGMKLVPVEIWQSCNLHETDLLIDRFYALNKPLALTGIHLCKMLSPAFINLVNSLDECVYICLVPCCLPRVVISKGLSSSSQRNLVIRKRESIDNRRKRLKLSNQYEATRRKNRAKGICYICKSSNHWIRQCPQLPTDKEEQSDLLQTAAATTPCWNCGKVGHFKFDCPEEKVVLKPSETMSIDVSHVLASPDPVQSYCNALSGAFYCQPTKVIDTGLENATKHQSGNWNSARKSWYIVTGS